METFSDQSDQRFLADPAIRIWLPTSQVKDLLQERESKQLYLTQVKGQINEDWRLTVELNTRIKRSLLLELER